MSLPGRRGAVSLVVALEVLLAVAVLVVAVVQVVRRDEFSISMAEAPLVPAEAPVVAGASTGSYTWDCGRNERGHRNAANIVVTPGKPGPPHHLHDYVGNLGVDASRTVESIAGQPTSCGNGDDSTYFWPVLRFVRPGQDEHGGPVQVPVSLTMTYLGNPRGPVLAMPRLLRAAVGDAYAHTNGGALARARWSCSNTADRQTTKYPKCEGDAAVVRVFEFPSCWDGVRVDSPNHRQHLVFPLAGGGCPVGTFAVPRLRITAAYAIPPGTRYRIDAFDGQRHDPATDHGLMVNLMPDALMKRVVTCLNKGTACDDTGPRRSAS